MFVYVADFHGCLPRRIMNSVRTYFYIYLVPRKQTVEYDTIEQIEIIHGLQ